MPIPDDFRTVLPQTGLGYDGPVYWLWVFDPMTDSVRVEENESQHPAHAITHNSFREDILHPNAVFGYAYRIKGGWRITDADHKQVRDPHILKLLLRELH
jgi:hypothetical protein